MKTRLALALILWLGLLRIATWPVAIRMADDVQIPQGATLMPAGEISRGLVVRQIVPAPGRAIDRVSLYLATYQRPMRWPMTMRVEALDRDGAWVVIWTQTIEAASIRDNSYYTAQFSPPIAVPPTRHIAISLSSDAPANEAASWWTSPSWSRAEYGLQINDRPVAGAAVMSLQYSRIQGPLLRVAPAAWRRATPFLAVPWEILLLAAALGGLGASAWLLWPPRRRDPAGGG